MASEDNDSLLIEATESHLKNLKLAIEFKHLAKEAPAGVYMLPETNNIRVLHGVICVRRGLYADGVFRFRMDLPEGYNGPNTHPKITFTPPIFNPFIDLTTGEMDLRVDDSMKEWRPEKHYLITAVSFLKKAFFAKSYEGYGKLPNEEARQIFDTDKDLFLSKVAAAVEESDKRLYDPQPAGCTLIFTEPKPAHEEYLKNLFDYNYRAYEDRGELVRPITDDDTIQASSADLLVDLSREDDETSQLSMSASTLAL